MQERDSAMQERDNAEQVAQAANTALLSEAAAEARTAEDRDAAQFEARALREKLANAEMEATALHRALTTAEAAAMGAEVTKVANGFQREAKLAASTAAASSMLHNVPGLLPDTGGPQ